MTLSAVISGLLMGGLYALIAMDIRLKYAVARGLNIFHTGLIMLGEFVTTKEP